MRSRQVRNTQRQPAPSQDPFREGDQTPPRPHKNTLNSAQFSQSPKRPTEDVKLPTLVLENQTSYESFMDGDPSLPLSTASPIPSPRSPFKTKTFIPSTSEILQKSEEREESHQLFKGSIQKARVLGLSQTALETKQNKKEIIQYVKQVINIEKLEETSIMFKMEEIEVQLYTALVTQFAYINFFMCYCLYLAAFALVTNLVAIFLVMMMYGYFSRKSVSRRMQGIGMWNEIFKIIALLGVVYNVLIMYKRRKVVFYGIIDEQYNQVESLIIILISEHLLILVMFLISKVVSIFPPWVSLRIQQENEAQELKRAEVNAKREQILAKLGVDETKDDEDEALSCLYKNGMRNCEIQLPRGYDLFPLVKIENSK